VNVWIGWVLTALALAVGYWSYGWRGVVLAFTVIVFWLLLQFSRALRTMRLAAGAPVGRVGSVVMLQARLKPGLRLIDVIPLTRSLGERVSEEPELWRWRDDGGAALDLTFARGRLVAWQLQRQADSIE
jgi:uncharacterized protein (DUF58 family)